MGVTILLAIGSGPIDAGQAGTWTTPVTGTGLQDRPLDPTRRTEPPDPGRIRQQEEQAKRVNDDRQKRLESDTTKLFELAAQLKEQVAKSDKNTLSVDVVKKAEEIEHLAKSVKDKMRG
jgi:hypothetical protein